MDRGARDRVTQAVVDAREDAQTVGRNDPGRALPYEEYADTTACLHRSGKRVRERDAGDDDDHTRGSEL